MLYIATVQLFSVSPQIQLHLHETYIATCSYSVRTRMPYLNRYSFSQLSANTTLCNYVAIYRICGIFRGMKFLLSRKQTEFLRLYFRRSQVHRGKVARVMYCYKSLIMLQTSKFSRIKFLLSPQVTVKFTYHGNFHAYSSQLVQLFIAIHFVIVQPLIISLIVALNGDNNFI